MITTMPTSTSNHNVPNDVLLMAEEELCSGEITITYYIDRDSNMFDVCDWVLSKPYPVSMRTMCRKTGLTEQLIAGMYDSWRRNVLGGSGD
jgi:hypothetical protein